MAPTPIRDAGYPVFAAIAKELYGDVVDPRELWEIAKTANDASDVHIDGAPKKHNKTAGALLLGTAAEGAATYRAGQGATKAIKAGGKLIPRARSVGEAALQGANLTVGVIAAHQLLKKPKTIPAPKPKPPAAVAKGFRTKKVVMSDAQLGEWQKTRAIARKRGMGLIAGTALLAGGAVGHHMGVKTAQSDLSKAFRVKPLNAGQARRVVSLKARRPPMSPPLSKSVEDGATKSLSWSGTISKVDEDKRQVFGWCSLSTVDGKPVVDLQGDYVPLEEIEKSAYKYVIESRKGGDMHRRVSKFAGDEPLHTADLIESFVVTPEKLTGMGLAGDALPHGWWVGFKVNDDTQWQLVKEGKRAGFSIHGTGQRHPAAA